MKKLLVMLVIIVGLSTQNSAFAVSTADSTIIKLSPSTTEHLIDKYSSKVVNSLTLMLDKVKGPAKDLFRALVRIEIVRGGIGIFMLLLSLILWLLFIKESNRIRTILNTAPVPSRYDTNGGVFDDSNSTVQLYVYVLGSISIGIIGLIIALHNIDHLISPEWFAVKDLVALFIK